MVAGNLGFVDLYLDFCSIHYQLRNRLNMLYQKSPNKKLSDTRQMNKYLVSIGLIMPMWWHRERKKIDLTREYKKVKYDHV